MARWPPSRSGSRGSLRPSSGDTSLLARRAVEWALARRGDPSYAGRCLAFVEDAYERANQIEIFGGSSAAESAGQYGTQAYDRTAPPPLGSFVFYACTGPLGGVRRGWGHVGLALGDGRVVHAWDVVRVDTAEAVSALPPTEGWEPAELIGWTPVERVLQGRRHRDWNRAAT